MSRAEYMREYRKRRSGAAAAVEFGQCINHGYVTERCCVLFEPRKAKPFLKPALGAAMKTVKVSGATWATRDRAEAAEARVAELEEEVRRLKQELAGRPIRAEGSLGAIAAVQGIRIDGSRSPGDRFGSPRPAPKTTRKAK